MKYLIIFMLFPLLLSAQTDIIVKADAVVMAAIKYDLMESNGIGMKNKISQIKAQSSGNWHDEDNFKVWKLNLKTEGDYGIIIYFDRLILPQGSSIVAYSSDKRYSVGPFYKNNNKNVKTFALPEIPFNEVIVEARIPKEKQNYFEADISEIGTTIIRQAKNQLTSNQGFGSAASCYVNVNCSDADGWQDQKRSVVKYTYTDGGGIETCSGALVNNTNKDDKNYMLTAQHCGQTCTAEELGQAVFYFNYEAPSCENPDDDSGLTGQTVIGCSRIAASGPQEDSGTGPFGSDFHLFEINKIPDSYNIYYSGWNRHDLDKVKGNGVVIHHPFGDIKKISFWGTFERSYTSAMDFEAHSILSPSGKGGTVEPNSSGSPVYDNQKLIVGTVSYGSQGCVKGLENPTVGGGRFWSHWDKNGDDNNRKLAPFLDPSNSGVMTLHGKNKGAVSVNEFGKKSEPLGTVQLFHNYPNPFNPTTVINFSLPTSQNIKIEVFNVLGEKVSTLINKPMSAGIHKYEFNASKLNSGLYLYRLTAENFVQVKKMMLLK